MHDTAVGGLAALLSQQDWRSSGDAAAIAAAVTAGLHDDSPVVRMRAAEGLLAVHADAEGEQRASAIGDLLLTERDDRVRAVLLQQLAATAAAAPTVVDHLLERLHNGGDAAADEDDLHEDVTADVLTYLAVVAETPFAAATVERWCKQAPTQASAVRRFAQCARKYLARPGDEIQARAFAYLRAAVETCTARLAHDPLELSLPASELTEAQRAEIQGSVLVCHDVAEQVYFASGAFDGKADPTARRKMPDAGFADLAMPVLRMCASTRVPQCVHPAVQTMVFLAPLDEARTLQAVADAVPADSSYAGDSLAGDLVVTYLKRLLAEQRPLVLFDAEGANAFRRLLATFAAAGNQEALSLAYTFADVFR
jgi:hypothetical protein